MLRITALSLLLGGVALVATLKFLFLPPGSTASQAAPIHLITQGKQAANGTDSHKEGKVILPIDKHGTATRVISKKPFAAGDYPFLHLALDQYADISKVVLTWKTAGDDPQRHSYTLENTSWDSLWLATREMRDWEGQISQTGLLVFGQPQASLVIRDFSLLPSALSYQLQAMYSDWVGYVPWTRSAMNSHSGVTNVASFYPVPLTLTAFLLSLLGYGLILTFVRSQRPFRWQVVGLIFLAWWIVLDLAWQNRLLQQVADTHATFSGKNTEERRAVGPDAKLYDFVAQAAQNIDGAGRSRVFVSSTDEYIGLRSAYYLYPFNVYWTLNEPELPHSRFFRSDDYVLLIKPTSISYNKRRSQLVMPDGALLEAELLLSARSGLLVQVK